MPNSSRLITKPVGGTFRFILASVYLVMLLHPLHEASLAPSFAKTLLEYQALESESELWDLSQVPSHGHTSTSLADGS
jgi:hypothetical protein